MAKVIGKQYVEYVSKAGYQVRGYNIYCTYEAKDVEGLACIKQYVSKTVHDENEDKIQINSNIEFLYDRFGKVKGLM